MILKWGFFHAQMGLSHVAELLGRSIRAVPRENRDCGSHIIIVLKFHGVETTVELALLLLQISQCKINVDPEDSVSRGYSRLQLGYYHSILTDDLRHANNIMDGDDNAENNIDINQELTPQPQIRGRRRGENVHVEQE
ncbi:hypothetical protein QL285_061039 [Trifolium repens]|nr:hypothetical protein QL285_061039 [Trifolium repens]